MRWMSQPLLAGRSLKVLQQFTMRAAADDVGVPTIPGSDGAVEPHYQLKRAEVREGVLSRALTVLRG